MKKQTAPLAMMITSTTGAQFFAFSAVLSGVKEIKEVIQEANEEWKYDKRRTILFVDEIHRFNKAQQDAFLPHVEKERGLGQYSTIVEPEVFEGICRIANGDARIALNTLEMIVLTTPPDPKGTRYIKQEGLEEVLQKKAFLYDKSGEEHYNILSALPKSLRGSDPDAALYWLGRM